MFGQGGALMTSLQSPRVNGLQIEQLELGERIGFQCLLLLDPEGPRVCRRQANVRGHRILHARIIDRRFETPGDDR